MNAEGSADWTPDPENRPLNRNEHGCRHYVISVPAEEWKIEKKKKEKKNTLKNKQWNIQKPNAFASPRRPQFWRSSWEQKFWKRILKVCAVSVGATFGFMLLVSPDTNFDDLDILLLFGLLKHNAQLRMEHWMQHVSMACFAGYGRSCA